MWGNRRVFASFIEYKARTPKPRAMNKTSYGNLPCRIGRLPLWERIVLLNERIYMWEPREGVEHAGKYLLNQR